MTKQELQQLRNEITLNSLYTSDYDNSFNIDARQVQDFLIVIWKIVNIYQMTMVICCVIWLAQYQTMTITTHFLQ